jgi:hypothetical protein
MGHTPTGYTILDSDDYRRTAGVFPGNTTPALDADGNVVFWDPDDFNEMHHIITEFLFSDALSPGDLPEES